MSLLGPDESRITAITMGPNRDRWLKLKQEPSTPENEDFILGVDPNSFYARIAIENEQGIRELRQEGKCWPTVVAILFDSDPQIKPTTLGRLWDKIGHNIPEYQESQLDLFELSC